MAHRTLVNGTSYEISGGKPLVNGTAYSIDKGKTKVNGTVYEIGFLTLITFTIDGTAYQAEEGMTWLDWCGSQYNTGGFEAIEYSNRVICYPNGLMMHYVTYGGSDAMQGNNLCECTDVLISGQQYGLYYPDF